jgi:hypothetical protein
MLHLYHPGDAVVMKIDMTMCVYFSDTRQLSCMYEKHQHDQRHPSHWQLGATIVALPGCRQARTSEPVTPSQGNGCGADLFHSRALLWPQ